MAESNDYGSALGSVLRMVEVQGALFLRSEFTAPWGLTIAAGGMTFFHIVTRGQCWLEVEGVRDPIRVGEGDLVIMPHGTRHSLRDDFSTPAPPLQEVFATHTIDQSKTLRCGGGGEATSMICGEFRFADRNADPLLHALPNYIRLDGQDGAAVPWLKATLEWISEEASVNAPGAETVVQRLTDILFIQAIRAAFVSIPDAQLGWLGALKDERLAKALASINLRPDLHWTVDALAKRAGMSRSGFAAHFSERVGVSPMQYVTRWRIHHAASLLRSTDQPLADIARAVGYDSEAGFSKAFKRRIGVAPGRYRSHRTAPAAADPPFFADMSGDGS